MGTGSIKGSTIEDQKYTQLKTVILTATFFLVIGAYTLAKELGGSIFMSIVGRDYVPYAKIATMIALVPAIFLYSYLVDKLRRYQLFCFYSLLFGTLGLIFTYFLGHPSIGIPNTDASKYRIFGWIFYFFVEGYSPFVVSVFWAFANSVTSPDGAKNSYGFIAAGSKLGGMVSAGLAWALFSWSANPSSRLIISDVSVHQIVFAVSSTMLLCVPFVIMILMRLVPGRYLHGYEAVYQAEKRKSKEKVGFFKEMFSGLILLLQYPYVLGIFGMLFFYEVVATVISYLRLTVAQSSAESIAGVSSFLFKSMFATHFVGLIISLCGTTTLPRLLGERICLMLIPLLTGILLLVFMLHTSPDTVMVAFILMKAINYAFSWPLRETLYIPTIKEIKFKSKSWIDAFGSKFAKMNGSGFNLLATFLSPQQLLSIHAFFFAGIVGLWFGVAWALGSRFEKAVENNEVIGFEE